SQADARHALFKDADLEGALLNDVKLAGAELSGVRLARVRAERIDVSEAGDGSQHREGAQALAFLRGEEPSAASLATTRYFGKGDVLRDATLEFGKNSVIRIDSRFQNCSIRLSEGAELTIGEEGVLKDCSIVGAGKIVIHGRFFERSSPGIAGARSVVVSSRGGIVSGIEQATDATVFAFEPGSRLRVKIHKVTAPQAAE
ncbi:MAG TPA: pentapeptide repeat-containing protein, partial [Polyangiaceae bacterium]